MASPPPISITTQERQEEEEEEEPPPAKPPLDTPPRPKKRSSALSLMRAALFMARRSSKGKNAPSLQADVVRSGGKGIWRSLVGGMRPLHMQRLEHGSSPRALPLPPPPSALVPPPSPDRPFHDVLLPPPSPVSSVGGMSRYASAEDLQSLEKGTNMEDIEIVHDDGSPNLIDVQAEEFIARFYEQIRLQRLESVARGSSMNVERGA